MMKQSPFIGITTYHRNEKGHIHLPDQYADSVRRAGSIPLLIQSSEPQLETLRRTILDGLILSGGGIEAIEMPDKPHLLAVQWHPELTAEGGQSQQNLFKGLVDLAGAKQQRGQWH